jgi:hypothetical protein
MNPDVASVTHNQDQLSNRGSQQTVSGNKLEQDKKERRIMEATRQAAHTKKDKGNFDQVSGIFDSYQDFVNLLEAMYARGYKDDDLSVLMSEETHDQYFAAREESKAPEGTAAGVISGGLIGALIGGLTLVGNVLAPGVGLLMTGPLVGAISGAAIGAAAGGLVGGMIGAGIPEHEAKFFEEALNEKGRILLVAHVPKEESKEIRALFERFNASKLKIFH